MSKVMIFLLLQAWFLLGCASHQIKPVSLKPVESYPNCLKTGDLVCCRAL